MKKYALPILFILLLVAVTGLCGVDLKRDYPIKPVPFTDVRVKDAFWTPRMETNRTVTIPYVFKMCEETGRIDNFAIAAKMKKGKFKGYFFNDSDVYKAIEGAAYALATNPDPDLVKYVDDVVTKIAAAQEPDGYLYTARELCGPDYMPPGGKERWSDMESGHELYCLGHLYEAAVAYYLATGHRALLDVALKSSALVCNTFGPGKNPHPCGHQEIEIGLVKLYRLTGDEKYLAMAKFFLDTRGHAEGRTLYGEYAQDHKPVCEQTEAVGHAVRAQYMYSAMADVSALTGERPYMDALDKLWEDVVLKKLYITGGIGATGGIEGFGAAYDLPNPNAYCETCAAIANALWDYRMFLTHGDAKYLDALERVIYNGFLSGISLKGDRFFYSNRLESFHGVERSPWFECACCPPNDVRFIPSIAGYIYGQMEDRLYVNLFIGGTASVKMDGKAVTISQETGYPWEGNVRIKIDPEREGAFSLCVRIPGWAAGKPIAGDLYRYLDSSVGQATISINGSPVTFTIEKGFARLTRSWKKGDVVAVNFPMTVRRVIANDNVMDDRGKFAIERGPIVFCAEGVDNNDGHVLNMVIPDDAPLAAEFSANLLGGVEVVRGNGYPVSRGLDGSLTRGSKVAFLAIPYYSWANRGKSEMTVWPARVPGAAKPLPVPTIAYTSKLSVSGGTGPEAITDQLEPKNSNDHSIPYFHWWPNKGTKEWVQLDFRTKTTVSSTEIYWFDDTGTGECRVPESWTLTYKDGVEWKPVEGATAYGLAKDTFNAVRFAPVETTGLKLEVQLQKDYSAGLYEWKVK